MRRRRFEIPLDHDGSARFLPWLIALMVYLAALALIGTLALNHTLANWSNGLAGTLTVEIPAAPADQNPGNKTPGDGGLAAALATLAATPGVLSATPLDAAATAKLIEPWLGPGVSPEDLALPRLVDLRLDTARGIDLAGLKTRLAAAAPGAVLDDHRLWLDRLVGLARSVRATALAILALIGAAAALTVIFTTRTGLSVHRDVIELLHLMGAQDRYIAGQFQRQALRLGLAGGLAGLGLTLVTLFVLGHAGQGPVLSGDQAALLPSLRLEPRHWVLVLLLPVAVSGIAMVTARLTVMRALARMP